MMQEKSGCRLTVSLLVCGREDTTEKCLKSLRPLLDGIPSELILVDTGCRSKFRKKLYSYTDKIIPFAWCNDFAAARNAGLAQAQGEWFMFLDDDEWFEDVTPILDFFRSGNYRRYHQAVYKVRNYRDTEGKDYNDIWVSRMTRRDPEVHFEGKIHEYLEPVVGDSAMLDCFAHHYGYAFTSEEQKRAHAERNIPLLLEMIQEQPENMRWHEHLLIEYYTVEDFPKLRSCAENAIGILSDQDDTQSNLMRGTFYTAVLMADQGENAFDRLQAHFDTFIKDRRNPAYVKCSLYKMAAFGAQMNEKMDLAVQYAKLYFESYEVYEKEKKDDQTRLLESTIIYVRDNVTEHMVNFVRAVWATSLIFSGRKEEFPAAHRKAYQEHLDRKIAAGGYEIPQYVRLMAQEGLIRLGGKPAAEAREELPAGMSAAERCEAQPDGESAGEPRPLLTISLLASNRPDTIRRCLDSLKPVLEQLPSELILVDTSQSEEIHAILLEYTDQVVIFPWCNDFSKARNEGLSRARGEWFLFLDDDEWFVNTDELVEFFRSGEYRNYCRARYIVRNFLDEQGIHFNDGWHTRIIRIDADTHFEGRVHEFLTPMRGQCRQIPVVANHTGYIFRTEEDRQRHFERNSTLLKELIEEEPDDPRWKMQMIQEYGEGRDWENEYMFSRKCLDEWKTADAQTPDQWTGCFYAGAVEGLVFLKRYEEAAALAESGLADGRTNRLCKSFLLRMLGEAYYRMGQWELSEKSLLQYLENYAYMQAHEDEWEEQRSVLLVSGAFDVMQLKNAYSILCCIGLKRKDTAYLKQYFPKLEWEKNVIFVYDDFPPVLFEAMSTMPTEEIFLTVWKAAWRSGDLQNRFRSYLRNLIQHDGEAFTHLLRMVSEADPDTARALYAEFVPEEGAQEKETGAPAADEPQQKETGCPATDELQKETGIPAADVMQRKETGAPAADKPQKETSIPATDELQQMKKAILQKIPVLLQSGMYEDALATVRALRQILPGDAEIEAALAQVCEARESS